MGSRFVLPESSNFCSANTGFILDISIQPYKSLLESQSLPLMAGSGKVLLRLLCRPGKTNLDLGYYLLAYQQLGYSSHFLTDLGNPLHTGKEAEQLFQGISPPWSPPLYSWVHNNYEGYVNAYWSTAPPSGPYAFSYFVMNNWYYYPMTDPFLSAQSLAQYSNTKLDTLYYYVYNNPYTLQNDPNTYMITTNCFNRIRQSIPSDW